MTGIIIFLTIIIPLVAALLQVTPIIEEAGYTMIQTADIEIVNEISRVIHITNPNNIQKPD